MKTYLKDFEKYMVESHGVVLAEKGGNLKERKSNLPSLSPFIGKQEKR